jgi:D-arabinose 1-dehydrogenase-like Zn-dependent alcohol dehydrogenase
LLAGASAKRKKCSISALSIGSGRRRMIPIQKINEAYERMINNDVRYRFVIDIASLH